MSIKWISLSAIGLMVSSMASLVAAAGVALVFFLVFEPAAGALLPLAALTVPLLLLVATFLSPSVTSSTKDDQKKALDAANMFLCAPILYNDSNSHQNNEKKTSLEYFMLCTENRFRSTCRRHSWPGICHIAAHSPTCTAIALAHWMAIHRHNWPLRCLCNSINIPFLLDLE